MLRRNFIAILLAGVLAVIAPFAGAQDYYPPAIGDFDGAADSLRRGSDLTGSADGKQGTVSFWYRVDGGDGTLRRLIANTTLRIGIFHVAADTFQVFARIDSELKKISGR